MNGLLSSAPSPSAIRLALGGYLLLQVVTLLVFVAPARTSPRGIAGLVGFLAWACLIVAIAGVPEAPNTGRRWRHGR